ncbi:MAG: heme-binding protein [Pseudomonadota bacterium]
MWIVAAGVTAFVLAAGWWIYATFNVPVPAYAVVEVEGDVEIRDYPALVVAEVTTRGTRGEAVRSGFSPLARYIFAREREGEKIAMTAPVTQRPDGDGTWTVQFIMPEEYTLESLPQPAGAQVALASEDPVRRAAIRFSGSWDDERFAEQEATLRAWLSARGLTALGPATYAYYNDPFTPPFLRRNEILIDLAPSG